MTEYLATQEHTKKENDIFAPESFMKENNSRKKKSTKSEERMEDGLEAREFRRELEE